MGKKNLSWALAALFHTFLARAQFPGVPESPGTDAIDAKNGRIVAWASSCKVNRGFKNILEPDLGRVSFGEPAHGCGKADGLEVVSLGDGGFAELSFRLPIVNKPGPDFLVFENSFADDFLELAFVEVSFNGIDFVRFPAVSLTQTATQIGPFDQQGDPTKLYNLAGKYRAGFGTPFDLEEIIAIYGPEYGRISHVRIVDVVGTLDVNHRRLDSKSNPINDPFPTAFESGGFDLDAVGVLHQDESSDFLVFPNPATADGVIRLIWQTEDQFTLRICDFKGSIVAETEVKQKDVFLSLDKVSSGPYLLLAEAPNGRKKLLKLRKN